MKRWLSVLLLVFTAVKIDSKGIFTITMPGQFSNNPTFNVGITTQDLHEPLDVNITVFSDKFSKSFFETCEPGIPKLASLDFFNELPKNESLYDYKVRVESHSGIVFAQEAFLGYSSAKTVVMVQTDKGIYKPGDRVRFRVIYTDREGLAENVVKSTVYITDGKGNRIKEWKFNGNLQGVLSENFLLSKEPVLGFWNIYVNIDDEMVKAVNFKVEEYVLPKFQVSISPSGISSFKKGKFVVIIDAKYTYGKPVKGSATVQIPHPRYFKLTQQQLPQQSSAARRRPPPRPRPSVTNNYIRKVVPINGRAIVEFDIKKDFLIDEVVDYVEYISVEATVSEELTGIALSGNNNIPIYPYDYVITVTKQDASFKPGLPFQFEVQISKPDGKPYVPKRTKLQMTTYYGFDDKRGTNSSFTVDKSGKVRISNTAPLSAMLMDFKFHFKAATASLYLTPDQSESNSYIRARADIRNIKGVQYVYVTVVSTKTLKHLFYTLYNRQQIIKTQEIRVKNKKFVTFRFQQPSFPVSKLLIWYTTKYGEIVSDVIDTEGAPGMPFDVQFSVQEVRPGNNVDILVKPNCGRVSQNFVALAAVDQSVLLLSEGNTVSQKMFNDNFQQFNTYGNYPTLPKLTDRPYSLSYYPSYTQMVDAGVIVFTNAITYKLERGFSTYNYYGSPPFGPGGGSSLARKASTTRRGDAMVMADRGPSTEVASAPGDSVRRDFPETWIWEDILYSCYLVEEPATFVDQITKKAPDTITSWVLTAFANNPYTGFKSLDAPRSLRVFKPFFASLTLPYAIIRGEVLQVSVQVFNYLATASKITVTLDNKYNEFVFMTGDEEDEAQSAKTISISVDANAGVTVAFYIKATKIGYITLSVISRSSQAQDYLEQQLLVKPEGTPVFVNKVLFYDLRNVDNIMYSVDIEVPAEAIPNYKVVELSVFGNLLGDTARNLEQLIRLPSGCGEQTIAAFAPNVAVLDYLKATNALTPEVEGRAKSYMESGYQNELRYQRFDGSFSCFGESDTSGSTWLTAFVVKTFSQAKRYITIDDSVLKNALNWLVNLQSENGRFNEVGRISHTDAQGDGSGGAALTSFVVIAILAVPDAATTYQAQLGKATEYIAEFAAKSEDYYTLAIASYALTLAKHASAADIYKRFDAKATVNGQFKYWEKPIPGNLQKNRWYYFTNCIDIEITAYGLLANLATDSNNQPEEDSFPIMRWLISQRNSLGGFCSTQDTVLSISALALYAERIYTKDQDVDVIVKYDDNEPLKYKITIDNPTPVTNQDLGAASYVEATCSGTGFAIVQVSYRYNVIVPEPEPAFNLDITVDATSTTSFLNVTICTSFIPNENVNSTNMALVEVPFPSGYTFNLERLPQLRKTNNAKRVEMKNADTLVVIYFDYMDEREVCMILDATKTTNVALTKPVFVKVYDYYDNSRRARKSYSAVE